MTNYDIQITAVHDRKGGMIETKYVASIKDKKFYRNTALDAYFAVQEYLKELECKSPIIDQ